MALFVNVDPEEFLLFMRNFKMSPKSSRMLTATVKIHYLCTLLHVKVICKLDILCAQVKITSTAHLNRIILVLGIYIFPINALLKQKRAILHIMRKRVTKLIVSLVWTNICMPSLDQRQVIMFVIQSWTESFWKVRQMDGVNNSMCMVLIVKLFL